jgi:hypothetical protein
MWQNFAVQFNGITITNVEGDGMDVYPLSNEPGVNWYVTLNHSTIENVGYKAIVPEAADHFTIENSTIVSDDIDAEVDFACEPPQLPLSDCGTFAFPAIGVVNMTIKGDSFPNGLSLEDEMSCMPVGNWTIENNNFGTGGLVAQFDATYSLSLSALQACGPQSGLIIKNNVSTDAGPHCCGIGSPYILLQGWTNVTIANNHLVFDLNQGLNGRPHRGVLERHQRCDNKQHVSQLLQPDSVRRPKRLAADDKCHGLWQHVGTASIPDYRSCL